MSKYPKKLPEGLFTEKDDCWRVYRVDEDGKRWYYNIYEQSEAAAVEHYWWMKAHPHGMQRDFKYEE